jgi:hypothetical protein
MPHVLYIRNVDRGSPQLLPMRLWVLQRPRSRQLLALLLNLWVLLGSRGEALSEMYALRLARWRPTKHLQL